MLAVAATATRSIFAATTRVLVCVVPGGREVKLGDLVGLVGGSDCSGVWAVQTLNNVLARSSGLEGESVFAWNVDSTSDTLTRIAIWEFLHGSVPQLKGCGGVGSKTLLDDGTLGTLGADSGGAGFEFCSFLASHNWEVRLHRFHSHRIPTSFRRFRQCASASFFTSLCVSPRASTSPVETRTSL